MIADLPVRAPDLAGFRRITEIVARSLALTAAQLMASFTPAAERDLDGVVALRRVIFGGRARGEAADAEYLRWRYHFGRPNRGRGDCWVLVLDGSVVGMIGTEEVVLRKDGEVIRAWLTMDIAVHPQREGVGLGGWMNLRICHEAGCALTIGSNQLSRSMLSRTFQPLPNRRSYVHFLRFDRVLAKRLPPPPLARLAAAAARLAGQGYRATVFLGAQRGVEIRAIERFDATVNALIERAAGGAERWIVRTVEFLNWRLLEAPQAKCIVLGAYASGELVGFLALRRSVAADERGRLLLIDWLVARERFAATLRALCAAALREAGRQGAESVAVTAYHGPSERLFRRWGFLPRPNVYETVAVQATDPALLRRLTEPSEWFMTEANTDRDGV